MENISIVSDFTGDVTIEEVKASIEHAMSSAIFNHLINERVHFLPGAIHDVTITGTWVLGDCSIDDDRYPHTCPHCSNPAYIGGDGTVDCSSCDGVM